MIGTSLDLSIEEKLIWLKLLSYVYQSESLMRYLGINYKKGLFVNGPVGCGKTTLFMILQKLVPSDERFIIKSCKRVTLDFSINGFRTIHNLTDSSLLGNMNIMFDDLGAESKMTYFGNECNVFNEIISLRYELFKKSKIKTHFTSNICARIVEDLYSERIRSRLREMVNIISFPKNSRDRRN